MTGYVYGEVRTLGFNSWDRDWTQDVPLPALITIDIPDSAVNITPESKWAVIQNSDRLFAQYHQEVMDALRTPIGDTVKEFSATIEQVASRHDNAYLAGVPARNWLAPRCCRASRVKGVSVELLIPGEHFSTTATSCMGMDAPYEVGTTLSVTMAPSAADMFRTDKGFHYFRYREEALLFALLCMTADADVYWGGYHIASTYNHIHQLIVDEVSK